jgi:hypothetical protein
MLYVLLGVCLLLSSMFPGDLGDNYIVLAFAVVLGNSLTSLKETK